jgi:hypothetical protein
MSGSSVNPEALPGAILQKLRDVGYTPSTKDLRALLVGLGHLDDDTKVVAEQRMARAGAAVTAALHQLIARHSWTVGRTSAEGAQAGDVALRERLLCRALRAAGKAERSTAFIQLCIGALGSDSARVQREAVVQIGKSHNEVTNEREAIGRAFEALIASAAGALTAELARALIEATGKLALPRATEILESAKKYTGASTSGSLTTRAELRLSRDSAQEHARPASTQAVFPESIIKLWCRQGLERLVEQELRESGFYTLTRHDGAIRVHGSGTIDSLLKSRCHIEFGFELGTIDGELSPEKLAVLLDLPSCKALFASLDQRQVLARFEFSSGKQRALQWSVAEYLHQQRSYVVSAPAESLWTLQCVAQHASCTVYALPRKVDMRFTRGADVPAASHPTLAAALVRMVGVTPSDVIWDPFVGSGTELLERAAQGPFARLVGSDISEAALAAAQQNLRHLENWELFHGSMHTFMPPDTTEAGLGEMLDNAVAHIAQLLPAGGKFAWYSPRSAASAAVAAEHGLRLVEQFDVNMGGFWPTLQYYVKQQD